MLGCDLSNIGQIAADDFQFPVETLRDEQPELVVNDRASLTRLTWVDYGICVQPKTAATEHDVVLVRIERHGDRSQMRTVLGRADVVFAYRERANVVFAGAVGVVDGGRVMMRR